MINKRHTLPIAYTMLVKIREVSIIIVLLRVNLIGILNFHEQ